MFFITLKSISFENINNTKKFKIMENSEIKIGSLVYNKTFGRGIVEKISPSKSLVVIQTKFFGQRTVLFYSLTLIK